VLLIGSTNVAPFKPKLTGQFAGQIGKALDVLILSLDAAGTK
jgi:hypothetical protein